MVVGRKDSSKIVSWVLVFVIIGGTLAISFFGDKVPDGWLSMITDNFFILVIILALVSGLAIFLFSKFKPQLMGLMGKEKKAAAPQDRTDDEARNRTIDTWKKDSVDGKKGTQTSRGMNERKRNSVSATGKDRAAGSGKGKDDTSTHAFSDNEYL